MMVALTGLGLTSPLGASLAELTEAMRDGRVAAGQPTAGFESRAAVPARRARRLSRLALMTIAAARSALADARPVARPDRTAVVLGSQFGSLGTTVAFVKSYLSNGAAGAEPTLFPTSVLNEPAAQLAIELGLGGPNLTVTQHEDSFLAALACAANLLSQGRADAVLAGVCDELSPEIAHGLLRLGLVSPTGVGRPFDRRRDGFVPGEAAVVFMLEPLPRAGCARLSIALSGDAEPAARAALAAAERHPSDVDYVALGGSGSRTRDRAEAGLYRRLFPASAPAAGALAGAAGASGATSGLRLAAALAALAGLRGGAPGFAEPDPDAVVPGLQAAPTETSSRCVLVPGSVGAAVLVN